MRVLQSSVLLVVVMLFATPVAAQRRTVTVTASAPIFVTPSANQPPLRVAPAGAVLGLLETNADWTHVEFEDPAFGRRVGYIQTKNLRINPAAPSTAAPAANSPAPQPAQTAAARTPEPPVPQHGDLAVGYVFMHRDDVSLPWGIAGSGGWRLHPNVDVVVEAQFTHGNSDVLVPGSDANVWTVVAGPRVWSGARYGQRVRGFVEGLAGVLRKDGATDALDTGSSTTMTGFGVQPGFGVDVRVARAFAVRPEFGVLYGRVEGQNTTDIRFNVNVVFRLLR